MRVTCVVTPRLVAALIVLLLPGELRAQETPPGAALPDSIRALLDEFGALRERFETAQQQALDGDGQLRADQQSVRDLVAVTVLRMRPDLEELFRILPQIQNAAVAADQAGDRERVDALIADGRRIQSEIEDAQSTAIEQPEVAREIEAFERKMVAGMKKVDPEIEVVLERIQTIGTRLSAWMGKPS